MKKNNHNIYKASPTTMVVFFIVAIVFVFSLVTIYYYQQFKIASLQHQLSQQQHSQPTPTTIDKPPSNAHQ